MGLIGENTKGSGTTMADKNKELVLGLFDTVIHARQALKSLEVWDEAQPSVTLDVNSV
jgi:hypothetical protein